MYKFYKGADMPPLKSIVIFLAGVETFHAFNHMILPYYMDFPIHTRFGEISATLNIIGVIVNTIIAFALLVWASRLSKKA